MLALGARGLVNAQFIVRDDGVYLIEVNPRASRTVPFLSKVTGVPMVELAVRISLGATLPELGWGGGTAPAAAVRGGQGAGLLDGQAARRRSVGRARDAVDRRGHRHPHGPAGRAGQGAPGRGARPAATGRGGRAGAALDRGPRQGHAPPPRRRPGRRRLPAGRDARHARARWRPPGYEARPVAKLGEARRRGGRRGRDPRPHRVRRGAARGQHADPALRAPSATPPRSAWRPRPRGSCA